MEFRVLGPLRVHDDGRDVPLGGRRQQLVLASLLSNANRVVSTDRLVDAVWGEAPPATARKTLQVYVSRLRSLLGADRLEPAATGYVLYAGADEVDAARFERLARDGHDLLDADPAAAAEELAEALALWHGEPWGDLGDEPVLLPEAERLREARLTALTDRIEADVTLGRTAEAVGELEGLVARYPTRERLRGLLMLALYREGRQADALETYQDGRRRLAEELGLEPSPQLQQLEQRVLQQDSTLATPRGAAVSRSPGPVRNPYKGLRPFTERDATDFFGRRGLVDEIVARLAGERFVAVVGPSGCGKSSVVRAGVVPALRAGALPGSERWLIVTMVPAAHPLDEVAAVLHRAAPERPSEPARGDELDLLRMVLRVVPDDGHVLLVIDQLEELFTLVGDDERDRFVRNLAEAVDDPHSRLRVLTTMRADFFDRPLAHPPLGALVTAGLVGVQPLGPAELEAAAVRPATEVGVRVEPELVAELVADVAAHPGALPQFQYVLTELFDQRLGDTLTLGRYEALGGLHGAIARRAEALYEQLDEAGQQAARQVFLRLVALSPDGEVTRRRVPRGDLGAAATEPVLARFDQARLLTFDRDPHTAQPTVELAHEALMGAWPRVRGWIADARDDLRLHHALAADAAEWERADRHPDYLLTGSRLAQYETWSDGTSIELTDQQRVYLAASLARRSEEQEAERARQDREQRLERRAGRRLRALLVTVTAAALVAAGLAVVANRQRHDARASQREARVRELASLAQANVTVDPERSILLAVEAIDTAGRAGADPAWEAQQALHDALVAHRLVARHPGRHDVAFFPGGDVVTAGRRATRWTAATGEAAYAVGPSNAAERIISVAVSPDGALLATGSQEADVSLWDGATGGLRRQMRTGNRAYQYAAVSDLEFSPDGTTLASAAADPNESSIRLWDVASGRLLASRALPVGWNWTRVAFDPAGGRLAVAGLADGSVRLLDVASGVWSRTIADPELHVTDVGFAAGGQALIGTARDGRITAWNAGTGEVLASVRTETGADLTSLDVSPDGTRLVTVDDDGAALLWNLRTGDALLTATLVGHDAPLASAAFDASGDRVATIEGETESVEAGLPWTWDTGEEARVWDVTPEANHEWLTVAGLGRATYSPDGRWLAGRTADRTDVAVVDAVTGRRHALLPDAADEVRATGWSPDARLLATTGITGRAGEGGSTRIWTVDGQPVRTLGGAPPGHDVAFGPDGRWVVVPVCAGTSSGWYGVLAAAWDTSSGDAAFTVTTFSECAVSLDVGAEGRSLALQVSRGPLAVDVPAPGGTVRAPAAVRWRLDSMEGMTPGEIGAIRFSPDGRRVLTVVAGGIANVHDLSTGDEVLRLAGHRGPVERGAWSPDGRVIATAGSDGTVRLWDAATGASLLMLRGHRGTVDGLSFSPDGSRLVTSGTRDGLARVWALDVDDLVQVARSRLTRGFTAAECTAYAISPCPAAG